ncbi:MOSC domain-containing protein [Desulfosporosinus fructosivorans]|uniref:MOSC domain-containing protein n=1 Tax=Desulfosporosinus fructosivorans TaxID=2018669 RepID=A0A4Z0R8T6_9FIRM|nr:MOSC domain-containing protein [Desulfosporosinus fructosivorans]TGE38854.1 MOSC domain-containing protein [Desulfosporosinus fructosivorans]
MGNVLSIHVSAERGIIKTDVAEVKVLEGWGLEGDAHGGDWDRQVSVFPIEAMARVPEEKRAEVSADGYTENFTISGLLLEDFPAGCVLKLGEAEIEILYIGKEVFKEKGRPYIVSREGRFGRVLRGGSVRIGDFVEVIFLPET